MTLCCVWSDPCDEVECGIVSILLCWQLHTNVVIARWVLVHVHIISIPCNQMHNRPDQFDTIWFRQALCPQTAGF